VAKNLTASGSVTIADGAFGVLIQVNSALTGNFVVAAGGTTIATVTNPTVGSQYRYGGLRGQGAITVNPSTTCDITVSLLNSLS
jgi:hypothetical protein